ncbi:tyrosine-type recombinase/integrase [Sphingobium sp. CR28]|uniref:tyrosine-type recombinase/integrase n=1 Tax=Sphingobium sp. CR28 TaxID=3400272 RepID=UPI003FEF7804
MPNAFISKRMVDGLKASETPFFVWDDGRGSTKGFGIKALPSGKKVYIFQYRVSGRGTPKRYTIGAHGPWTPEQARSRAEELARMVGTGIDPAEAEREADLQRAELAEHRKAEKVKAERDTLQARSTLFLEHMQAESPASYTFYESTLRLHILPKIGALRPAAVAVDDIDDVLAVIDRSQAALRRNVWAVLRRYLNWLGHPPPHYERAPRVAAARDRVLTDEELRLLWKAADALSDPFPTFYRMLLLTGQRREEVAGLEWSELDRPAGLWTLPASRAKNASVHLVPLPAQALGLLDKRAGRTEWPRSGLVFSTTGKTSISGFSKAKAALDAAMTVLLNKDRDEKDETLVIAPWRVHDIRRTVATGLQRLGTRFEVTESVLNHLSGRSKSGVAAVYQRHDWLEEKRTALTAWARDLERCVAGRPRTSTGDNVVALATARSSPG